MSKKRRHARLNQAHIAPAHPSVSASPSAPHIPTDARGQGLREFRVKRYRQAITIWHQVAQPDAALNNALAEAHFRLGVNASIAPSSFSQDALTLLRQAVDLAPTDPIYAYHLGLTLHKNGYISEARDYYRRAVSNGLARKNSGVVMALAELELDPHADVTTIPGISAEDAQTLAPVLGILGGSTQPLATSSSITQLLRPLTTVVHGPTAQDVLKGLSLLASGNLAEARTTLTHLESKRLPRDVAMVQWHYIGVAAARLNDLPAAIEAWKQVKKLEATAPATTRFVPKYEHTLAVGLAHNALHLLENGDRDGGLRVALETSQLLPENQYLADIVLTESDRIARAAALSGDWATARQHWANALTASTIYTTDRAAPSFTRPPLVVRGLAHNLALACEAGNEWMEAADAWRMMLRTKPRKNSRDAKSDLLTDTHWAWLRKRVIACYKQAGDLAQAIVVCRQALKAQPDDIELHLDLAEALLANEQIKPATNELQKLLKKNPQHPEALARLAQLQTAQGEWHAAEQTLLQALQSAPDNPKLRDHMADTLIAWGAFYYEQGRYDRAVELFERALTFVPTNYNIHLWMARVEFNRMKPAPAREHLERALELGKNKGDAYVQAFECWVTEKNLAEARNLLTRAEANGQLTVAVYLGAGDACLHHAKPAIPPNPLDFLFGTTRKPKKLTTAPDENTVLACELFDRAIALGPETEVIRGIIGTSGLGHFQVLLPYIRRLAQLVPDDSTSWLLLGIALGLDQQVPEAQKALREAAQLARKQGQNEIAQQADELRKVVADPMFALAMQSTPYMGAFGGSDDDIDFLDNLDGDVEDPNEFFSLFQPARRKRGRR